MPFFNGMTTKALFQSFLKYKIVISDMSYQYDQATQTHAFRYFLRYGWLRIEYRLGKYCVQLS